jgi:hypothetical protein
MYRTPAHCPTAGPPALSAAASARYAANVPIAGVTPPLPWGVDELGSAVGAPQAPSARRPDRKDLLGREVKAGAAR